MTPGQPQRALLFMPDISGFTHFVSETEILHSQHIVQELLEILVDSNQLGLQICEVEGDAIFFYKLGETPDLHRLLNQVEEMFTRFHAHLKLYEHQRICPCGACKSAVDLSLKIIAHVGEVSSISVKNHKKLFGKDVILIHRLLKNNLATREYILLTDELATGVKREEFPNWYNPQEGHELYDLGEVRFLFSDLSELHKSVRVNFPLYNSSSRTYVGFCKEQTIDAPMEKIFETLFDMQQRALSSGRRSGKEQNSDPLLKIGERHPCLITRKDNANVTESVKVEAENIELVEMNAKGIAGYRYILHKLTPEQTRVSIEMLIKDNPFFRLGFLLGIKARMMKRINHFMATLGRALSPISSEMSVESFDT